MLSRWSDGFLDRVDIIQDANERTIASFFPLLVTSYTPQGFRDSKS